MICENGLLILAESFLTSEEIRVTSLAPFLLCEMHPEFFFFLICLIFQKQKYLTFLFNCKLISMGHYLWYIFLLKLFFYFSMLNYLQFVEKIISKCFRKFICNLIHKKNVMIYLFKSLFSQSFTPSDFLTKMI